MNKIAAALVKAQKSFAPALKTNTNPHFRSKYVGLDGCVEAVIDALNENGIFLMQLNHESDSGVIVETMFIHESGETLSAGKLHVPASKLDAQGFGSALTYARRYSLMAACGIAPEDDDGNAASTHRNPPKTDKVTPMKHTPAQGAFDALDATEKAQVQSRYDFILDAASANAWDEAYEKYDEIQGEQRVALFELLGKESSIRAKLKKMTEERKAA